MDLGKDSVGKLLFSLAVPAIAAQIINMLYNIVDRIYIGHIPEIGTAVLTGVGITFPLITLISAFSALIAMGGAPQASIAIRILCLLSRRTFPVTLISPVCFSKSFTARNTGWS